MTTLEKVIKIDSAAIKAPAPQRWIVLGIAVMATFMAILDSFVVTVGIPAIQHGLNASTSQLELVVTGYTLAYAASLIIGGRLGDLYGRKRIFILGMAGFVFTSILCGIAPTAIFLIVGRVLQGLTAALMVPQVLAIIRLTFYEEERTKALGIYGATIGLASITGQLLGGLLIDLDVGGLGWRSIFLVNVPVGLLGIVGALVFISQEARPQTAYQLDWVGAALLSLGMLLLIYPLVEGRETHWAWWLIAISLAACTAVFTVFVLFERHLTTSGTTSRATSTGQLRVPLIHLPLFKNRNFMIGLVTNIVFYSGNASFNFLLAFFVQTGLGYGAFEAGLTFLPLGLGFLLASLFGRRLFSRRKAMITGALLMVSGYSLVLGIMMINFETLASLKFYELFPAMLLEGLGQGLIAVPLLHIILAGITSEEATGSASGIVTTVTESAKALGIALIGIIFFSLLSIGSPFSDASLSTVSPNNGNQPVVVTQVYAQAFNYSLIFFLSLALVTLLLVMSLTKPKPSSKG